MATATQTMRKLLNDPERGRQGVARRPCGRARRHPARTTPTRRSSCAPTRRVRARSPSSPAAARGTSRCTAASSGSGCSTPPARARCSPRRCPTRCSPRQGRRRRRGRRAPGQELHGRRHELQAGGRGRRRRGDRRRVRADRRRRRRAGLAVHRGAPRRRRDRARREDRGRGGRARRRRRRGRRRSRAGSTSARARSASRCRRAPRRRPASRSSTSPTGEIEVGIGIHGEPGRRREALGTAREVADVMVEAVVTDLAPASGAQVLPFVNGMGGTPLLELYLLYGEIERGLRAAGLEPVALAGRPLHHVAGDGRRVADAARARRRARRSCGMLPSTPPRSAGGRERWARRSPCATVLSSTTG